MANASIESIQYVRVKDAKSGKFLTDPIPFVVDADNVIVDGGTGTLLEKLNGLEDAIARNAGLSLVSKANQAGTPVEENAYYKLWFVLEEK